MINLVRVSPVVSAVPTKQMKSSRISKFHTVKYIRQIVTCSVLQTSAVSMLQSINGLRTKAKSLVFKTTHTAHLPVGASGFHYTNALHNTIRKLGLGKLYIIKKVFKRWVPQLMALPFLTEEEISPIFMVIHLELVGVTDI